MEEEHNMRPNELNIDWYSLFGKTKNDPDLQAIINIFAELEQKSFKDNEGIHEYKYSYRIGLSLSFKNEIFCSVFLYGKYDKKFKEFAGRLPYFLDFDMNNSQIVSFLGDPNKKTGGRTIPITISYERLGIEFTFISSFSDDKDNKIGFICLFPKEKENIENAICAECRKEASVFCTQCKLVTYCSRTCQGNHWMKHRVPCNKYFKVEKNTKN